MLAVLLGSCASRGPMLDRMDADALFARGTEQLERRNWSEAAEAFRRFVLVNPNDPRAPEALFRVGEAYQGRREWITAATEFNRVATDYPASPWAERGRFESCRSYYRLAPRPQLDQEYSRIAIEHCNALTQHYPASEFTPRALEIITELTNRLAEKEYLAGEHYYNRRAFDSALLYYQLIVDTYPTTIWAPRSLLRMVQVYDRLDYQPEATAARERLLRDYPASPEARQIVGAAADTVP